METTITIQVRMSIFDRLIEKTIWKLIDKTKLTSKQQTSEINQYKILKFV